MHPSQHNKAQRGGGRENLVGKALVPPILASLGRLGVSGWRERHCLRLGVSIVALVTSCCGKALWQDSSRPLSTPLGGGTWECSCTPVVWRTSRWASWVLGGAWHENIQLSYHNLCLGIGLGGLWRDGVSISSYPSVGFEN